MRRALLVCCVFALALRLGYVFVAHGLPLFPDEQRFLRAAGNFADHFGVESGKLAHDMPLTAIMGGLVLLLGGDITAIRAVQCLASALLVLPVCAIARRLHDSAASVWLAGLATAVYPFFIFYSALYLSETWFVLLTTWAFAAALAERPRWAALGGTLGLAHLTRPTLLWFLPVLAAWEWVVRKTPPRTILAAAGVFCLLLAPWVARNYQAFGVFMAANTGAGQSLWESNNPWNPHGGVPPDGAPYLSVVPPGLDELARDQYMKKLAIDEIVNNPERFARLAVSKFQRFWSLWPNAEGFSRGLYKAAALASFGPVLALALLGLYVLRDRWRELGLIWLFVGYYTALHMVALASIRYRLPLEPLLIACAAACAARLLGRQGTR